MSNQIYKVIIFLFFLILFYFLLIPKNQLKSLSRISRGNISQEKNLENKNIIIFSFTDIYILDNLPKIKTYIDTYKKENPENKYFTIVQGDFLGPSLLSSFDKGKTMVEIFTELPVDIICLGNHEFDYGLENLLTHLETFKDHNIVVLNSNMYSNNAIINDKINKLTLKYYEYENIVFTGGCFKEALSKSQSKDLNIVQFTNLNESLCNISKLFPHKFKVALTHQDENVDLNLLKNSNFDIIFGGHNHHIVNHKLDNRYLLKSGSDAKNVFVVKISKNIDVNLVNVENINVSNSVQTIVDLKNCELSELSRINLMKLDVNIDQSILRNTQNDSIQKLLCLLSKKYNSDYSFIPSGSIRFNGKKDSLTLFDLKQMFPFNNHFIKVNLEYSKIKEIIEWSEKNKTLQAGYGGYIQYNKNPLNDSYNPTDIVSCVMLIEFLQGLDNCQPIMEIFKDHKFHTDDYPLMLNDFIESILDENPQYIISHLKSLDSNNDKVITKEEFSDSGLLSDLYHLLLNKFDSNKDNQLSFTEL